MPGLVARLAGAPRRLSEAVLLRRAERRADGYGAEQAQSVRRYHQAAVRRLTAARDLRDAQNLSAGAALYREGATLAARARVAAADASRDVATLSREEVWAAVTDEAPGLDAARELALRDDSLDFDALSPLEARTRLDQVDRALLRLLGEVEPRTVRRIRWSRRLRIAALVAGVLGALVALVVWALAPKNVARGKPVHASGYWPGSEPGAALVNGVIEAPWGSATAKSKDPWFRVDLLAPYRLDKVVIVNRDDRFASHSAPASLSISMDGTAYEEVVVFQHAEEGEEWVYGGQGKVARYLQITRLGAGSSLALSEIKVYGPKQ